MKVDILIVGGGLVGLIAALALANQQCKIALIDQNDWPQASWKPEQSKALALNHSSITFLQSLHVFHDLNSISASIINRVHVSEKGAFSVLQLSSQQAELPFLGYLIPEAILFNLIKEAVLKHSAITVLRPTEIKSLEQHQEKTWKIFLTKENQPIETTLIIAADGSESTLRKHFNIKAEPKPYQQAALVCQIQHSHSHQQTAYQRFTTEGTLAFLPTGTNKSTLIITGNKDKIERWQKHSESNFLHHLQNLFGFDLGKLLSVSNMKSYPLQPVIAEEQIRPGFLLLGNAAHFIHPVAAQGLNLSIQDIKSLQAILFSAQTNKQSLADFSLLQEYDERIKKRQEKVFDLTDTIINLFSSQALPQSILRKLGLSILQLSPTLKKHFTRFAAGY